MGPFSFQKQVRLLKRAEFVNLNRSGKRHHAKHFIVIAKYNGLQISRLGVSVSKRVGNAIIRNRVKRLIREFFRLNRPFFPHGYDFVVIAKKDSGYLDFKKTQKELGEFFVDKKFVSSL